MTQLIERIDLLAKALVKNYDKSGYKGDYNIEVMSGRKYYKLMEVNRNSRAVHAFVDATTGAIYKPASWRGPAKHARYQLLDDVSFQECLKKADWVGGYLYLK